MKELTFGEAKQMLEELERENHGDRLAIVAEAYRRGQEAGYRSGKRAAKQEAGKK